MSSYKHNLEHRGNVAIDPINVQGGEDVRRDNNKAHARHVSTAADSTVQNNRPRRTGLSGRRM